MDFEQKLNALIFKYDVDEHCPNYRKSIKAASLARSLYFSLKSQEREYLLLGLDEMDIRAFLSAIDCEDDCPIKYYEELSDIAPGTNVLLISYYQKDEIAVRVLEQNAKIVSLYDYFEENGLEFNHNFYDIYNEQYWDGNQKKWAHEYGNIDINRVYFYHRRRYELEQDDEKKRIHLEKMIFDCVYIKDFLTLKENIDKHSLVYGNLSEKYISFYYEIEALLKELKKFLSERNSKDCIVFWLDALEYGMDETMPFLKSLDEKALVFEKAFTVTPYTSPTFMTLLTGQLQIEDEAYHVTQISEKDNILAHELQNRGYCLKYYGKSLNNRIDRKFLPVHFYRSVSYPVTQVYWDVLIDIISGSKGVNNFCILHELQQTHAPYVSFGIKGTQYKIYSVFMMLEEDKLLYDQLKKQREDSREYVDRQLEFWNNLLPDCMYKIYLSDHGQSTVGGLHTIMKVQQEDIDPCVYNCLFSYANFIPFILQVIDNHKMSEDSVGSNYALVQEVSLYDKHRIFSVVSNKKHYSQHPEKYLGFQGVVTKEDLLVRYENGFEYYQKHKNDHMMVTDNRLQYLRGLMSRKKPDYFQEEKFRYTRILLVAEQRRIERTGDIQKKKWEIIDSIFEQILDTEVLALRGGGFHTLNLLMPLKEQQRNKVRYIIDGDHQCVGGKMGIEVITLDEMAQKGVTTVLISSYQYLQEWEQELQSYEGIKIINMYRILEEHGLTCEMEARFEKFIDEDFVLSLADG